MNEDVWLLVRRMRAFSLESRRARSRCFLSSLCSGVKAVRGGLDVIDRATLGGVRLASDPWLVMEAKSLSMLELEGLCSRAPEALLANWLPWKTAVLPTRPCEGRPGTYREGRVELHRSGSHFAGCCDFVGGVWWWETVFLRRSKKNQVGPL